MATTLILLAAACGNGPPVLDYYDPWGGIDPWDPCSFDPYSCWGSPSGYDPSGGGYDTSGGYDPSGGGYDPSSDPGGYSGDPGGGDFSGDLVLATPNCSQGDASCQLRSASEQVHRSIRAVSRWARILRRSPPSSAGSDLEVHGPVLWTPAGADANGAIALRLSIASPAGGPVSWTLEAKPSTAADVGYRVVFSGQAASPDDQRRSGSYAIDLGPLQAPASPSTGRVSGTFLREGDRASTDVALSPPSDPGHPLLLHAEASRDRSVEARLVDPADPLQPAAAR